MRGDSAFGLNFPLRNRVPTAGSGASRLTRAEREKKGKERSEINAA